MTNLSLQKIDSFQHISVSFLKMRRIYFKTMRKLWLSDKKNFEKFTQDKRTRYRYIGLQSTIIFYIYFFLFFFGNYWHGTLTQY